MTVHISGSIAFDTIMVFEGRFRDHILPDQVHMLNVAFLTPQMRQEYGGCAANIAYTLNGLGQQCSLLGAVGKDGDEYLDRLAELGIHIKNVLQAEDCFSAQAFITTDMDDNQITAFHPGAMNRADEVSVGQAPASLGIISPNGKGAMIRHAREFAERGVPFIFDPGQAMPIFDGEELRAFLHKATWVAVNDYEGHMLSEKVGMSLGEICAQLAGGLIVTKGAEGVEIFEHSKAERVEGIDVASVLGMPPKDPTGCGDAFRAGLLFGLAQGACLADSARIGNIMGALKVVHRGAQNHVVDQAQVRALIKQLYPSVAVTFNTL